MTMCLLMHDDVLIETPAVSITPNPIAAIIHLWLVWPVHVPALSYRVPDDLAQFDTNVTPLVAKQCPPSLLMSTLWHSNQYGMAIFSPSSPVFSCLNQGVSPFFFCSIPFGHDRWYVLSCIHLWLWKRKKKCSMWNFLIILPIFYNYCTCTAINNCLSWVCACVCTVYERF